MLMPRIGLGNKEKNLIIVLLFVLYLKISSTIRLKKTPFNMQHLRATENIKKRPFIISGGFSCARLHRTERRACLKQNFDYRHY
jgi:hypothetical protein